MPSGAVKISRELEGVRGVGFIAVITNPKVVPPQSLT